MNVTENSTQSSLQKVTVVANCHTGPLAQILAFNGTGLSVDGIFLDSWHDTGSDCRKKADELLGGIDNNDIVFAFRLSSEFGSLETTQLRSQIGNKLVTFKNIRFDGLHPDTTYFGPFGGRWGNFLSEYHSKIVVHCFAAGRSVDDCLSFLNGKIYEKLGYYDIFENSAAELRKRDIECDVKCADMFLDLIRNEYSLLTINHPTSIVFNRVAKMLCEKVGIRFLDFDEKLYPNPLVQAVIWPVYDEVAEHLGLSYRTPQYFVRPPSGYVTSPSRTLSIPEFVAASYDFYEKHFDREQFILASQQMDGDSKFRNVLA